MPNPEKNETAIPELSMHQAMGNVGAKRYQYVIFPLSHLEGNHTVLRRKTGDVEPNRMRLASTPEQLTSCVFSVFSFIHGTTYN